MDGGRSGNDADHDGDNDGDCDNDDDDDDNDNDGDGDGDDDGDADSDDDGEGQYAFLCAIHCRRLTQQLSGNWNRPQSTFSSSLPLLLSLEPTTIYIPFHHLCQEDLCHSNPCNRDLRQKRYL